MPVAVGEQDPSPQVDVLIREGRRASRRRRRRRWLHPFSSLLILAGLALLLVPLVWRAEAWWFQRELAREAGAPSYPEENPVMTVFPPAVEPVEEEAPPLVGDRPDLFRPFKIVVPALGVDAWVVLGTAVEDLRRGPGLYREGVYPGARGNAAIAAHRTGYGGWFRHLDRLREGDLVRIEWGLDTYTYVVERVWVTEADDWSVLESTAEAALTLTTCDPPGTTDRRLVVRAWLQETPEEEPP